VKEALKQQQLHSISCLMACAGVLGMFSSRENCTATCLQIPSATAAVLLRRHALGGHVVGQRAVAAALTMLMLMLTMLCLPLCAAGMRW
jgi:hypothetical protein